VAASAQLGRAYVTDFLSQTVSVIDILGNVVIGSIPVPWPKGIVLSPDGSHLYVVNSTDPGSVTSIDTATNTVTTSWGVGQYPVGIAVTPDGSQLYVTNTYDDRERRPCFYSPIAYCDITVSVIDTLLGSQIARIPVGDNLFGVAVDPNGQRAYVAHQIPSAPLASLVGALSVIDTKTHEIVGQVQLGFGAVAVAVDPATSHVYVTGDGVSVIDSSTLAVLHSILVDSAPLGLSVDSDAHRLYVANPWDNTVSVIDTNTDRVIDTITVGTFPTAFGYFLVSPRTPVPTPTPSDFCPPGCVAYQLCQALFAGHILTGQCDPAANCSCTVEGPTRTPTPTVARCSGDCEGDGVVTIADLLKLVNISLGIRPVSDCLSGDVDGDGKITIDEVLRAVNAALSGCPADR
jgi:YVTN family beta-propeller protein